MTTRERNATAVAGVALAATALGAALGPVAGVTLLAGLALVASTAWLGPRGARIAGTGLGAAVAFGVARAVAGPVAGAGAAIVFGVVAYRSLPTMVMRR